MTTADAKRVGLAVDKGSFQEIGSGASGAVREQAVMLDRVEIEGRTVSGLPAVVADGLRISLLSQDYLRHLDMTMSGVTMVLK